MVTHTQKQNSRDAIDPTSWRGREVSGLYREVKESQTLALAVQAPGWQHQPGSDAHQQQHTLVGSPSHCLRLLLRGQMGFFHMVAIATHPSTPGQTSGSVAQDPMPAMGGVDEKSTMLIF
jgi:hypothetical protein